MHANVMNCICIVVLLWGTITESTCCFSFSGLCRRLSRKQTTVHPCDNTQKQMDFHNCLYDSSDLEQNISSGQIQLSPKSQMISEMQLENNSVIQAITDLALTHNVQWFGVDSDFIINTQNNTIIKANINTILTDITVYDITHFLYWIGHYLPLKNSSYRNTMQFQRVFDYFSQFENGVHKVNLKRWVRNFEQMREKVGSLLKTFTEADDQDPVDIPDYLRESISGKSVKIPPNILHRIRIKRGQTPSARSFSVKSVKQNFWNTDWINWKKEPLRFHGLDHEETQYQIEIVLLRISLEMDRLFKILVGYDDHPLPKVSIIDLFKIRKAVDVLVRTYFKGSLDHVAFFHQPRVFLRFMALPNPLQKLSNSLRQLFIFDTVKFLLPTAASFKTLSRRKRITKGLKIKFAPHWLRDGKSDRIVYRCQFSAESFGGHRQLESHLAIINQYMVYMLRDERTAESIGFSNIQEKGGVLFLLNMVLQFAIVGGRCGYGYNEKDKGFEVLIVCEASFANINEKGDNFKIPRKFIEKRNGTEDYDWMVLEDFTGLKFQDIENESSDSLDDIDRMMMGIQASPHRGKGITIGDLHRHNMMMEYDDMEISSASSKDVVN